MTQLQVTCVHKPNRYSAHEHITHIGGNSPQRWLITREEAIRLIENKSYQFYTKDPYTGKVAIVGVVREYGKLPYLRTYADRKYNNNLLELAACPVY